MAANDNSKFVTRLIIQKTHTKAKANSAVNRLFWLKGSFECPKPTVKQKPVGKVNEIMSRVRFLEKNKKNMKCNNRY